MLIMAYWGLVAKRESHRREKRRSIMRRFAVSISGRPLFENINRRQ